MPRTLSFCAFDGVPRARSRSREREKAVATAMGAIVNEGGGDKEGEKMMLGRFWMFGRFFVPAYI